MLTIEEIAQSVLSGRVLDVDPKQGFAALSSLLKAGEVLYAIRRQCVGSAADAMVVEGEGGLTDLLRTGDDFVLVAGDPIVKHAVFVLAEDGQGTESSAS